MAKTTKLVGYGVSFDMELVGGVKTANDFEKAAKSVTKSLNRSENAAKQFELQQEQLNQALQQGAITKKQYDQAMTTLAFREQKRLDRLERERRAVLGLDKQESILEKNRRNRARMAGMAASGVSGLGMGGRAAGAARFLGGAAGLGGPAAALGLGFGTVSLLKESVSAFAKLESQVEGMKSLFGEDIAVQLNDQFRALAKTTILTNSQLIENARTWASYGLTTEGLTDRLKRLGTVAGGNSEKFRALTIAFAQVNAQGKLMGQEKNQLINAGFSLKAVADAAGISMDDFADSMKNGEITAEHLNEALVKVTSEGGMFAGYLEKQAETINGKITILSSSWEEFLVALGESEQGPASFIIDRMIDAANELKAAAEWWAGKGTPPTPGVAGVKGTGLPGVTVDTRPPTTREAFYGMKGGGLPDPRKMISEEQIAANREVRKAEEENEKRRKIEEQALEDRREKLKDSYQQSLFDLERFNNDVATLHAKGYREGMTFEDREFIREKKRENEAQYGELFPGAGEKVEKMFPEIFGITSSEDAAKEMEELLKEEDKRRSDDEARNKELFLKQEALTDIKNKQAKDAHEKEMSRIEKQEKAIQSQFAREQKIAKGPSDKDAMFTGGSVEEFMFLRKQTQVNEAVKATKEAEDRAQQQRDRIAAEKEAADKIRDEKIIENTAALQNLADKLNISN